MRRSLSLGLFALLVASAPSAFAQENNCPPGSWFCEETEVPAPPAAEEPAPPAAETQKGGTTIVVPAPPAAAHAPPPVVVYQPVPSAPPPRVIIVAPGAPPTVVRRTYPMPPAKPKARWYDRWGFNMRLEGVLMGGGDRHGHDGPAKDAGMGGLGMSLRYRPVHAFAFDVGVDLLGGKDYNGFERTEIPLSLSGILYVNPRSRAQLYFTGGADWSHAHVKSDTYSPMLEVASDGESAYSQDYAYFGWHGGIGLDIRLGRRVSLGFDLIGFVRKRTDDKPQPEFIDADGRTTKTSGGGLFRGGLTFWW